MTSLRNILPYIGIFILLAILSFVLYLKLKMLYYRGGVIHGVNATHAYKVLEIYRWKFGKRGHEGGVYDLKHGTETDPTYKRIVEPTPEYYPSEVQP